MNAKKVIKLLGGVSETARFFKVSRQAVSQWQTRGIPKYRKIQLQMMKPEVFRES